MSKADIKLIEERRVASFEFIKNQNRLPKNKRDHKALSRAKEINARYNRWIKELKS